MNNLPFLASYSNTRGAIESSVTLVKKRAEKNSLYEALNIATIWLERILEE